MRELTTHPDFRNNLSGSQQQKFSEFYQRINPYMTTNLVAAPPDGIEIGQSRFVDDLILLSQGIIEILYLLRNSLFHGQIVPNQSTQRVYEPAYHILHKTIQGVH